MMSFDLFLVVVVSVFCLFGVVSVVCVSGVVSTVREAVHRRDAGSIRFRLPPASMAKPQRGALASTAVLAVCVLLMLPAAISGRHWSSLLAPLLLFWAALNNLQSFLPRRHSRRWLLLTSGGLSLAIAAIVPAIGIGAVVTDRPPIFSGMPRLLVVVLAVAFSMLGADVIREWRWGTVVRDRGIEIFGKMHSPSRIVFKGWQESDGETMLRLAVRPSRLFDVPFGEGLQIVVPVPASERAALEAFFGGAAASAEGPRIVEPVAESLETSSIQEDGS
jgi:hypothetical protein